VVPLWPGRPSPPPLVSVFKTALHLRHLKKRQGHCEGQRNGELTCSKKGRNCPAVWQHKKTLLTPRTRCTSCLSGNRGASLLTAGGWRGEGARLRAGRQRARDMTPDRVRKWRGEGFYDDGDDDDTLQSNRYILARHKKERKPEHALALSRRTARVMIPYELMSSNSHDISS